MIFSHLTWASLLLMFLPALNDLSQLPINYIKKEKNRGNFLNGKNMYKRNGDKDLSLIYFLQLFSKLFFLLRFLY